MANEYRYDVAISFSEKDRNAALALALALEMRGVRNVYYYPYFTVATLGKPVVAKLESIYSNEAKYAVVLLSKNYFDEKNEFTGVEFESIKKRMLAEIKNVYMIPVVLDKIELEEIRKFIDLSSGYIPWNYNPKFVARCLMKRLGKPIIKHGNLTVNINVKGYGK